MNNSMFRKLLSEITYKENFPAEEYQDKYFLLKKIKNILPNLSEKKISDAIDFANKKVKLKGRKKKYISTLSFRILNS